MGVLLQARQTLTADEQKALQEFGKATARRHHMTSTTFTPEEIALTELALEERERALEEGGQACSKDKASCDSSILIGLAPIYCLAYISSLVMTNCC